MMISILSWIFIGLLAGRLAGLLMVRNSFGLIGDLFFGSLGGLGYGYLASRLLGDPLTEINQAALMVAFLGAAFTVALARSVKRRSPVL